jgi:hypothetical protein
LRDRRLFIGPAGGIGSRGVSALHGIFLISFSGDRAEEVLQTPLRAKRCALTRAVFPVLARAGGRIGETAGSAELSAGQAPPGIVSFPKIRGAVAPPGADLQGQILVLAQRLRKTGLPGPDPDQSAR